VEQVEFLTDALLPGSIPPRQPAGLVAAAARGRALAAAVRRRLGTLAGAPRPPVPGVARDPWADEGAADTRGMPGRRDGRGDALGEGR